MSKGLKLIKKEYPIQIRSQIYPVLQRAYSAVRQLRNEQEFLKGKLGDNLNTYLINTAVEYYVKEFINKSKIPINTYIKLNSRKNHYHLELGGENSILTISHVRKKGDRPKKSNFRVNHSLGNQLVFDFLKEPPIIKDEPIYILMVHGGRNGELEFVTLGLPNIGVNKWLVQLDLTKEYYQYITPEVTIEEEELVGLKNAVKEVVQNE